MKSAGSNLVGELSEISKFRNNYVDDGVIPEGSRMDLGADAFHIIMSTKELYLTCQVWRKGNGATIHCSCSTFIHVSKIVYI